MELAKQNNLSSGNNIKLTENQINLAYEIEQLNEIYAPFKLSDDDITRWVKRISELKPEITPEILNNIVINFITGNYKFNKNYGIANIFNGYSLYKSNGLVR